MKAIINKVVLVGQFPSKKNGVLDGKMVNIYAVSTDNGVYKCYSKRITDFVGKEASFTEEEKIDRDGSSYKVMKLDKETPDCAPSPGGGFSRREMILSYAKDIVVALIQTGKLDNASIGEYWEELYKHGTKIIEDKVPF